MSSLRDALMRYVTVRRALGAKFLEPALTLDHFVDFLEREGADHITINLALRWATERENVQRATWARRLSMVRRFATWLVAFDPRTEIPPKRLLCARHRRSKPYIFTDKEIERLMEEAAQLCSSTGLRALTYQALIGLLATTGLRPGEALALGLHDVDLQNGILAIKQTKFGKSRFVPVEDSTRVALAQYVQRCNELCSYRSTKRFFLSERGTRLDGCAARRTFAKVSRAIGLRPAAKGSRTGRDPRFYRIFAIPSQHESSSNGIDSGWT